MPVFLGRSQVSPHDAFIFDEIDCKLVRQRGDFMRVFLRSLIAAFLFVGVHLPGSTSEFVTLHEKAMGQSLNGSSLANDSLYTNPASSAFMNVYSVDGAFQLPKSFAVSVLDTKTSSIGGGLGYYRRQMFGNQPTQGAKLALGGKVSDTIGIGVAGKMLWGPTSIIGSNGLHTNDRFNNVDVGVLANLGGIQFGGAIRNVFGEKPEMEQEREFSVGGRISYDQVLFLSGATQSKMNAVKPYQYGIGAEYVSPYFFALRGGYRVQPEVAHSYWGLGASFVSPRLALHYAVELPNQSSEAVEHTLGATLLF